MQRYQVTAITEGTTFHVDGLTATEAEHLATCLGLDSRLIVTIAKDSTVNAPSTRRSVPPAPVAVLVLYLLAIVLDPTTMGSATTAVCRWSLDVLSVVLTGIWDVLS